jgi:hypothetical protein
VIASLMPSHILDEEQDNNKKGFQYLIILQEKIKEKIK